MTPKYKNRYSAVHSMGEEDPSEGAAESVIKLFSAIDLCAVGTQD